MIHSFEVRGTGIFMPPRVLTNQEIESMVDTSDQWIVERTGISERRIASAETSTSDLIAPAVRNACEDAGLALEEVDTLLVATSTPDTMFPSTACLVQERLGIRGPAALDVAAGCTGWLYALELAGALISSGRARNVVVAAGEVMSKVVDWTDRRTCVLFGDGAAAAVVSATDREDAGVLASNWGADGTLAQILYQPAGGTQRPASAETIAEKAHVVHMDGGAVFRQAVRAMSTSAKQALESASLTPTDVDLMIPHQANIRIIEATRSRVGVPLERTFNTVSRYGNVSAATIPIALHEAKTAGKLSPGDRVLLTSFGTGLTWASTVLRW